MREQVSKCGVASTFLFYEYDERFRGVLFKKVDEDREHLGFPIHILKYDAMVHAKEVVVACFQADVKSSDTQFKLLLQS